MKCEEEGIYLTRENEELCDFGIAKEGSCMQWGSLLCILREELVTCAFLNISRVQNYFSTASLILGCCGLVSQTCLIHH